MPTIKDVARLAGFSIATVSRAINSPSTVNPITLTAVRAAVETLQFVPNPIGRALRNVRSQMIGVMVPTLTNPIFAECLHGIDELATQLGFKLLLMSTEYDRGRERQSIAALRAQRVEGMILNVADAADNPMLDVMHREAACYVLVHNDTPSHPSVAVDNRRAAYDGVRLLIENGHRRILMLAPSPPASDRTRQRYTGYAQALAEAGLGAQAPLTIDFDSACLAPELARRLAAPGTRPTAIFCGNDLLAMNLIRVMRSLALSVPGDISVIGFDGLPVGELLAPPLSSVSTPNREIGRAACRYLAARIAGENTIPARQRLPHALQRGATIAPLPHAAVSST